MIKPEDIAEARRLLGRQLAEYRQAAGYNQHQFAPLTHYGRSTIANVETGRQKVTRAFWQRCDEVLEAKGELLKSYDAFEALERQQHQEAARLLDAERRAKAQQVGRVVEPARAACVARSDRPWPSSQYGVSQTEVYQAELVRLSLNGVLGERAMADTSLEDWEQAVLRYGQATRFRPPDALLADLTADLADLQRVMAGCHSVAALRRLTRVTAHMAGLMFLTLIKLDERVAFRRWARTARVAAKEADDLITYAWVLAQEAYGHYYCGDFAEAVVVAQQAQTLAGRTPCAGGALAAALEARASAALGRDELSRKAIRRAEAILSRMDAGSRVPSAFGYTEAQLRFHEGNALTHLHDTAAAWQAQRRALALCAPGDYLDRTLVRLDRAGCLAYDGDTKGAMAYTADALLDLTEPQRCTMILRRGHEVVQAVPPPERSLPAVREVRELLMLPAGTQEV